MNAEIQPYWRAVEALAAHTVVATGLGEWCCKCSPGEWRPTVWREAHLADALVAVELLEARSSQ